MLDYLDDMLTYKETLVDADSIDTFITQLFDDQAVEREKKDIGDK